LKNLETENAKMHAELAARDSLIAQLQDKYSIFFISVSRLKSAETKIKEVQNSNKSEMSEDTYVKFLLFNKI